MRLGLCQINPTVGDLEGNVGRIIDAAREARSRGAEWAIFPELALCGYPPKDLLERTGFIDSVKRQTLRLASLLPKGFPVLVGFVDQQECESGRRLYNAVALIEDGGIRERIYKRLLPTYDVFDEDRYFEKGDTAGVVEVKGVKFGITICEDAWNDAGKSFRRHYHENPVRDCIDKGADVIINVAASPFTLTKRVERERLLSDIAKHYKRPLAFVNQVGGNDNLVFDGNSSVFSADGEVSARAKAFEEQILVSDLFAAGAVAADRETDASAVLDALVLGTRDYVHKCGFTSVALGLSGGVDSALVACIAARALGPDRVLAVALPTRYSSEASVRDAEALVSALNIRYLKITIDQIFQSYLDELGPALDMLGRAPAKDVTFENVQSRIRCATLMSISNRLGCLLLNTGNKSETASGYCTLYGDAIGAIAVIGDLTKTAVYRVAREVNRRADRCVIPESILTKAPSAELRPNQTDQDSLPPYHLLDAILEKFVEQGRSIREIIDLGFDAATVKNVASLVYQNEYKRGQMPPALIVTDKAFGPGRRFPIAHRYRD
ncbi:MAG: NAD+ synthase [Deltaproteobacteria bacterium]|nr:NAD+ synthase [Deltaproteobacteria bacterium]